MTVQELIDELNKIEDKSKEVYFYYPVGDGNWPVGCVSEYDDFIEID